MSNEVMVELSSSSSPSAVAPVSVMSLHGSLVMQTPGSVLEYHNTRAHTYSRAWWLVLCCKLLHSDRTSLSSSEHLEKL